MTPAEIDDLADDATKRSRAQRWFRTLQIVAMTVPLVMIVPMAVKTHGAVVIVPIAIGIAFAVLVAAFFGLRLRRLRRDARRTAASLAALGHAMVESPPTIVARGARDDVAVLASHPSFARRIARRSVRFSATGTWRGHSIEYGAAAVALRDFDVTVSYVKVIASRLPAFRAMTRGFLTRMSRWHRETHPVATGDEAFDTGWVVDADEAVVRALLAPGIRAQLVELRSTLASMQTASVETVDGGLVIRWPAPLSPTSAAHLRDVALSLVDNAARG